jgi:hypothetical protein
VLDGHSAGDSTAVFGAVAAPVHVSFAAAYLHAVTNSQTKAQQQQQIEA